MKKIAALVLLLCMALTFAAYAEQENETPEISLQEIYDSSRNLLALLGDHESVYALYSFNGEVIREAYLSKEYSYSFYDGEFFEFGPDNSLLTTDHAEYLYTENIYVLSVALTPDGMVDLKARFAEEGMGSFISSSMLNNPTSVTEEDGVIMITWAATPEELAAMNIEGAVSCEESYTIDANTLEMTAVKTVYRYEDGNVEEGIVTITRDAEIPEGMKPFLKYDQETENMRTITIVSNPGAENEKTESFKAPKGLLVGFGPDWYIEETFEIYADAACTQTFSEEQDVNADITIYIKWGE